ncbi:MAG: DegT/DnrJ/EryC1/StrS family aminotransferase [Planctomycetes bacterium]|nr:DegT/DnrJ/EryC1/StrS family aminotransferase [Planctomycetota bacterium]
MTSNNHPLPLTEPYLQGNEIVYVTDCIRSGWVSSLGEYIGRFEQSFAAFCGTRHGVAICNGTAALHLALLTLDIGPGDEVIVPSLTFIATANAVRYTGATPVFADCRESDWTIDTDHAARKVTPRTRAIIPVHLYGFPADMEGLTALAAAHQLHVVEDAAEAHGAGYHGRRVGGFGVMNIFSFYGNKIITTGEGGMITANDDALVARARFLRDHAMSPEKRYWHPEVGYNYRLTNVQAAMGLAQMEQIDWIISRKREIARRYNTLLAGVPGVVLPPEGPGVEPVYWMYSILVTRDFPIGRDALREKLKSSGIDSRPFFYPVHTLPPYADGQSLPVSERISSQGVNLPCGPRLTDDDIRRVAEVIRSCR